MPGGEMVSHCPLEARFEVRVLAGQFSAQCNFGSGGNSVTAHLDARMVTSSPARSAGQPFGKVLEWYRYCWCQVQLVTARLQYDHLRRNSAGISEAKNKVCPGWEGGRV